MPHILVVHSPYMRGDNQGIVHQHITALRWLLAGDPEWRISALDTDSPALEEASLACDLLIVQMLSCSELETIIRLRRERGRPTIFEIYDNIVAPGEWLDREHGLRSPLLRQNILYHASKCDALHVYSPAQLDLFGRVNPNSAVVDYYIPLPDERPEKADGFVVGWAGSRTHRLDLERIAPAVVEFFRRHDDAVFAFMGDAAMFAELFGGIAAEQVRLRPYSPHPEYLEFARTWHVGLGPLRDTPFNRLRADAKFVEYTSCGVASVLEESPVFAAHREHALLFSDADGVTAALEWLYADRRRVAGIAERAFEWVRAHRGKERLRKQRLDLYRSVLSPDPAAPSAAWREHDAGLAQRYAEARELAGRKDFEAAFVLCEELLRDEPRYAQAQSLAMRTLGALGRFDECRELLSRPGISPLCAESPLRSIRSKLGNTANPDAVFEELLAHQPYEYFALFARLRKLLREQPHSPAVAELLERACLVYPESVPEEWRPAHIAPFLPPCTTPFLTAPTA